MIGYDYTEQESVRHLWWHRFTASALGSLVGGISSGVVLLWIAYHYFEPTLR